MQKTREACQDLQIQLDHALQQGQDPNSKGNSLFSEVLQRSSELLTASGIVIWKPLENVAHMLLLTECDER